MRRALRPADEDLHDLDRPPLDLKAPERLLPTVAGVAFDADLRQFSLTDSSWPDGDTHLGYRRPRHPDGDAHFVQKLD